VGARLGQHFLFDPSILRRIADAARPAPDDVIVEIGAGKGTLTRLLAARAGAVVAIEKDGRLAAALERELAGTNVTVVQGDALEASWPPGAKVVGNIPYAITSPLIERALRAPRAPLIVFLMQREVAQRLTAAPGTKRYGALSAAVALVARVELLFTVRAGAFRPPPRVDSAAVRITPRAQPLAESADTERRTRALIRAAFQRRRQQLRRTLKEAYGLDAAQAERLLGDLGLSVSGRAEQLSPQQFVALARSLPVA
jgi:16S rRNA (adenine1518-N6/adenine1519-N6)-dimethyltransferase